jgi:hypothetical protein
MTAAQRAIVIANITAVFQQHAPAVSGVALVNPNAEGTLYELWALTAVIRCLRQFEGLHITLIGGNQVHFRIKPGAVNRQRSFFEVKRHHVLIGELMTNVEFLTISRRERLFRNAQLANLQYSDYHELDLALLTPNVAHQERPRFDQVILGAECKDRSMSKEFVRNMLGLRRELSMYRGAPAFPNPELAIFPRQQYGNHPASALMFYCNDPKVRNYRSIGDIFDIDLRYLRM